MINFQFFVKKYQTYVFADSVLCLGGVQENPNEAWIEKIKWYFDSNHFKELIRIDGMQTEFRWKIFPGYTTLDILCVEMESTVTRIAEMTEPKRLVDLNRLNPCFRAVATECFGLLRN